jgi:alkanesulfonate monooxygenase SsuD/methylene tetrahydromethanopterin reductase-like flavin-dependent oxidoreductase (luciferase family)
MTGLDASTQKRPLKIGIVLLGVEPFNNRNLAHWPGFLELGQTVEALGFNSLWFTDHLLMPMPNGDLEGPWESLTMLSALAASTNRITLAPFVAATSYRNPALIAKIAETIDDISNGRFILALGSGWAEHEYHAFGYPFDHRVARFSEAIQIITSLIRTGNSSFAGNYYSTQDCKLLPRGPRPNGLPIMIGTWHGERMMRLAAQYGDDWNVWGNVTENSAANVPALQAKMNAICEEVGRDPATLSRSCVVLLDVATSIGHESDDQWYQVFGHGFSGSPAEIAEEFRAYARAGISHLQVLAYPSTVESFSYVAEALAILDRDG